jgi:hypothetical protein
MPTLRLTGVRAVAALGLVLSLALAGCSSTASPTPNPDATRTPEPTAVEPTAEPTPEASGATGGTGPDINGASSALANLSSYRFAISIKGFGIAGLTADSVFSMEGTKVLKPDKALKFNMVGLSGDTAITYIVIGTDSWMDLGSGIFIRVPSDTANAEQLFDSFQADQFFGSNLASLAGGWVAVGQEDKNGVATTHFHVDKDSPGGTSLAAAWGDTAVIDTWVANDGGYLVSVKFSGVQPGQTVPFEIGLDISGIDDPANVISPPPS